MRKTKFNIAFQISPDQTLEVGKLCRSSSIPNRFTIMNEDMVEVFGPKYDGWVVVDVILFVATTEPAVVAKLTNLDVLYPDIVDTGGKIDSIFIKTEIHNGHECGGSTTWLDEHDGVEWYQCDKCGCRGPEAGPDGCWKEIGDEYRITEHLVVPKEKEWDDVFAKYKEEEGSHNRHVNGFLEYLKQNYKVPYEL